MIFFDTASGSVRSYSTIIRLVVLAASFMLSTAPAKANKVHCETKLFHNGVRVAHDDKTSSDANRDYVTCSTSLSHGSTHKGYAYAKEGWMYTGGQYILDNYQYTNCVHYGCNTHAHHHSTSPTPDKGELDQAAPQVAPPGTLTNISFTHVNYRDVGNDQISIELFPDTFVQIWLGGGLGRGEQVMSSVTLTVRGVASKVELLGRVGAGARSVTSSRTGLFKDLEYKITPYPNEVYVLTFTAPLRFNVSGSLMGDLALDGYSGPTRGETAPVTQVD